jgi:hypothetical protein
MEYLQSPEALRNARRARERRIASRPERLANRGPRPNVNAAAPESPKNPENPENPKNPGNPRTPRTPQNSEPRTEPEHEPSTEKPEA